MRHLIPPREVPPSAVLIPLPGRGDVPLLLLRADRMASLVRVVGEAAALSPRHQMDAPPILAIVGAVGILWAHTSMALETPPPDLRALTPHSLLEYGDLVAEELDAAGWDLDLEVGCLYLSAVKIMAERRAERLAAFQEEGIRERVGFFLDLQKATSTG